MTRLGMGLSLGVIVCALLTLPADAQRSSRPCTTLGAPSARRDEALKAVKMIVSAVRSGPRLPNSRQRGYLTWEALESSVLVATWKTDGGPMGELARKIRWGTDEPLPGWRIHFVATADAYAFTLTDTRDTCGYSYAVDDRELITQGIAVDPPFGIVPVETRYQ